MPPRPIPMYLCQPLLKLSVGAKNRRTIYIIPNGAKYAIIDFSRLIKGLINKVTTNATPAYPRRAYKVNLKLHYFYNYEKKYIPYLLEI